MTRKLPGKVDKAGVDRILMLVRGKWPSAWLGGRVSAGLEVQVSAGARGC